MALDSNLHHDNLLEEERQVNLRVLLFAGAREISGISEGELKNIPVTCSYIQLLDSVVKSFGLQKMAGCIALALNQNYIEKGENVILKEGDELAVIPPLSGG